MSGWIDILRNRRTQYALGRNVNISRAELGSLIRETIKWTPSAFNSQSSRALILWGDQSTKLWELVKSELARKVSDTAANQAEAKLKGFAAGIGTILFFEDQATVKDLQQRFPLYAENFPAWSEQAGGMAQFAVWTALSQVGLGASLQHYNPIVDAAVAATWRVPDAWKLRAQMPFGSNEAKPLEKTFIDDGLRFLEAG